MQYERQRIEGGHSTDIVQIRHLTKVRISCGCQVYVMSSRHSQVFRTAQNPRFMAVKNLSFGINNGECFGLLGVNGAGFDFSLLNYVEKRIWYL